MFTVTNVSYTLDISACGIAAPLVEVKSREAGGAVAATTTSAPLTRPTWVAVDPAEQALSVETVAAEVIAATIVRTLMADRLTRPCIIVGHFKNFLWKVAP
ncbi:hypothetical protein GCM10028828_15420 [Corynebacterium tapiri]